MEWLYSTKTLGPSLVSREISWASGMDFPIPPSFWWSIVCVFTKVGVATVQLVFISPPNDHFLPNRNKIATQSLVKIWTSYWSISQLHHWGICPSSKLWLWLLMFKDIIYYLLKTTYIPGWKFISVIGRTLPYALGWHQIQSLRHQVDD